MILQSLLTLTKAVAEEVGKEILTGMVSREEVEKMSADNFFKKFLCKGEPRNGVATRGESGVNFFSFYDTRYYSIFMGVIQ